MFPFEHGEILTGIVLWAVVGRVSSPPGLRLHPAAAICIALAGLCSILYRMIFPVARDVIAIIGTCSLVGAAAATLFSMWRKRADHV